MTSPIDDSKILAAAAMMLTGMIAARGAYAGPSIEQTPSEVVKFQELDRSASAGVATLYSRIHAAALRVCSSGYRDLAHLGEEKICAKQAEAKAVPQVNVGALTAYGDEDRTPRRHFRR